MFQLAALLTSRGSFIYMTYRVIWYRPICPRANAISQVQKYFIRPCKNNDLGRPKTPNKKMGFSFRGFFALFGAIDPRPTPDLGHPKRGLLGSFSTLFFAIFIFDYCVFWCDFFILFFLFFELFLYSFESIFLSARAIFSSADWAYFLIKTRLFFSTVMAIKKQKLLSHF